MTPRPLVHLGLPLQLGLESECELADVFLTERWEIDRAKELLSTQFPAGVDLLNIEEAPLSLDPLNTAIISQTYRCEHTEAIDLTGWETRQVERIRKSRRSMMVLEGSVLSVTAERPNCTSFKLRYSRSTATLKPIEVIQALGLDPAGTKIRKIATELA